MLEQPKTIGEFYESLPSLLSQFPVLIETGGRWVEMSAFCKKCDAEIKGGDLRGYVTQFGKVFVIEGWALCGPCKWLTKISYRLMPDKTMVGQSPTTGDWETWKPKYEKPLWKRLLGIR